MTDVLKEAKKLHDAGLAIIWLRPRSKKPFDKKWTSGERKSWKELERSYSKGFNLGVRLGSASRLPDGSFLAAIDCDVKGKDKRFEREMLEKLTSLRVMPSAPVIVLSGRGNGSRHYYVRTSSPVSAKRLAQSPEKVKVFMPSVEPSNADKVKLSAEEIQAGYRWRPAWEISLMGTGQQTVLPPSLHPDSRLPYRWDDTPIRRERCNLIPKLNSTKLLSNTAPTAERSSSFDLKLTDADILDPRIPDSLADMISTGKGVTDRSAALYTVSKGLLRSGLSEDDVLTILSDRSYFLGNCAYDHTGSGSRIRAMKWLKRYTTEKGKAHVSEAVQAFKEFQVVEAPPLSQEEARRQFDDIICSDGWEKKIERDGKPPADGEEDFRRPIASLKNVLLILKNAVAPNVVIRDKFTQWDTYGVTTPWGEKKGSQITDTSINLIREWLSSKFRFDPGANHVHSAVDIIAEWNSFHPVRDFLEALPEWDGEERLGTWLKVHLRARGPDYYLSEVFTKWMVAAVARIYEPGFQFDWMLILEGPQGVGKSTFFRKLFGKKYFTDRLTDVTDKDAAQELIGRWVIEMGELTQFDKNEIAALKAFITRTEDKYRPSYGRRVIEQPRQCVFAGTTNDEHYLRDDTGNRRFVPVRVGEMDWDANEENREQLWAEALAIYRMGLIDSFELEGQAREVARKEQEKRRIGDDSDVMMEQLLNWKERFGAVNDLTQISILKLFGEKGSTDVDTSPLMHWKMDRRHTMLAAKALKKLGCKKRITRTGNVWDWSKSTDGEYLVDTEITEVSTKKKARFPEEKEPW